MGRPAPISATTAPVHSRRPRPPLASAERVSMFGRRPPTRMTAYCLLFLALWALLSVSAISATAAGTSSDAELDSELLETETGWRFVNDDEDEGSIQAFDNATAPAPSTSSTKLPSGEVALKNGDFEQCNVTSNATTLADATATTMIPNWLPGGAGVQVIQSSTYNLKSLTKAASLFAIHLNNPAAVGNGTQGLILTTLSANPGSGKTFTVQYDTARMPDGPLNLETALKVSSISGTATSYQVHHVKYNISDSLTHMTWQRQSFVYTGTGASTNIQFESMSEKYGPAIDNVVILTGSHVLSAAPRAHLPPLWQLLATAVLAVLFQSPLSRLL